jgi:hypothetical protein
VRLALIGACLVLYAWLNLVDFSIAPSASSLASEPNAPERASAPARPIPPAHGRAPQPVHPTEARAADATPTSPPQRAEAIAPAPPPVREPGTRSRYETARRGPEFFDTRRNDY